MGVTFEECFVEHFPRLVALGEAMTGDRAIAHELAQESFLQLHRHWDTVSGYDNLGGWLRRVMSNLLIDAHRHRLTDRRAMERLRNRARPETVAESGVGEDWFALIATLPPRQRLIVTLFYGEDLAVRDIAELLELSPNTVKSALSKARDALRTRLENSDG